MSDHEYEPENQENILDSSDKQIENTNGQANLNNLINKNVYMIYNGKNSMDTLEIHQHLMDFNIEDNTHTSSIFNPKVNTSRPKYTRTSNNNYSYS